MKRTEAKIISPFFCKPDILPYDIHDIVGFTHLIN